MPDPSGYITEFIPEYLSGRSLRYFSALKNLRELRIDGLQLPSFVPHIEKRFGHFAPTLQTLVLNKLKASCRQILYLIGHFRELQNLGLRHLDLTKEDMTTLALAPPYIPPLCGWLTLEYLKGEEFVETMVALYGGLRFRCVRFHYMQYPQPLLAACAKTLETLQLGPWDLYCAYLFDLGRPKSTIYGKLSRGLEPRSITVQVP